MTTLTCAGMFGSELVVTTPRTVAEISQEDMFVAFTRHMNGDWGEVDQFDWQINDDALESGGRLVSRYHDVQGKYFLTITERDRSVTAILLPEDY